MFTQKPHAKGTGCKRKTSNLMINIRELLGSDIYLFWLKFVINLM